MHRLVQFHDLQRAAKASSKVAVHPPEAGNLPPELLRVLCAILAEHTGTPDSCCFCLWEGYGWLDETQQATMIFTDASSQESIPSRAADRLSPVLRTAARSESRVKLPYREYLLFEGPLEVASELGRFLTSECFLAQSPNLFWPRDHAWCVASEIDLFCTLVAGSNDLAEKLVAEPRLEAWHVFADDPVGAR